MEQNTDSTHRKTLVHKWIKNTWKGDGPKQPCEVHCTFVEPLFAEVMGELVHDSDPDIRRRAALTMSNVGDCNAYLWPYILESIRHSDPFVQAAAARGVAKFGARDLEHRVVAISLLRDLSRSPHSIVRAGVADALGKTADWNDSTLVGAAIALATDPSPVVRQHAIWAVMVGPRDETVKQTIIDFLRDPDPAVREHASEMAMRITRHDHEFAELMIGSIIDPQWLSKSVVAAPIFEREYPKSHALLLKMLLPNSGKRKAILRHLRFFWSFATCQSLRGAAAQLGIEGIFGDERHGQVRYHLKRLATILELERLPDCGLFRDSAALDQRKELTRAGLALKEWIDLHSELHAELQEE